jgi:hypothetical protein
MYGILFKYLLSNSLFKRSIKMSAQNVNVSPIENVAPDAVKQKKPTLAGKFSKLLNFGFWFASITDSEELKTQLHAQLRLFGSVEEQTELFERFTSEEKDIAKMIRKRIAEHNKPPKPVKEPKAKAPRKGKAVVHQDELISQLIADANAEVAEPKPNKADEKAAKEAAKLAKEEAARLAKEAKEEAARLAKEAKEEAARVAKEEKEAALRVAKEAKEEAARLTKEAKEEAARLAKLAKEEAAKAKVPKAKAAKVAPVVAPEPVAEVVAEVVAPEPVAEVVAEVVDAPVAPVVEDELVADVIDDLADTVAAMAIEAPKEVAKEEPKAKKATKATKEPKAAKEPKAKAVKEPKAKAAKKAAEPAPPAEEEEEIQTRIATIGDKDYLIDQEFNVYNLEEPHDHIGTYNQETGAIDAL